LIVAPLVVGVTHGIALPSVSVISQPPISSPRPSDADQERLEEMLESALVHLDKQRYQEALTVLMDARTFLEGRERLKDRLPQTLLYTGKALVGLKDKTRAQETLKELTALISADMAASNVEFLKLQEDIRALPEIAQAAAGPTPEPATSTSPPSGANKARVAVPLEYPDSSPGTHVDRICGTDVPDPYRWLEELDSPKVQKWSHDQSSITSEYFGKLPYQMQIAARITQLESTARIENPAKIAGRYFFTRSNLLQRQSALLWTESPEVPAQTALDSSASSTARSVGVVGTCISPDGKSLAFGLANQRTIDSKYRFRDVDTGKDYSEELAEVSSSAVTWNSESRSVFYSRSRPQMVYFHRLGTDQADDLLIYERPDHPDWEYRIKVSDDGRYLVLNASSLIKRTNTIFYRDIQKHGLMHTANDVERVIRQKESAIRDAAIAHDDSQESVSEKNRSREEAVADRARLVASNGRSAHGFVELLDASDASYEFIGNEGAVFYFLSDLNAPRGRVIAIDTNSPAVARWKELLPEADEILKNVHFVGDTIVANYLKDAHSQVKVFDRSGRFIRNVDLPGLGIASGFSGNRSDFETTYSFTGYATPPSLYRYDVRTGKSTIWNVTVLAFSPSDYETNQVFIISKDGTRVPMFISNKRGIKLEGSNPTLLHGYGGFSQAITPAFSAANVMWMEMGGIYAVANIRGGNEYGETWHQAALKSKRHNAHDDFIAAAEWLVAKQYTRPALLAVQGGGQGGLLAAAVVTQRPGLFGAAVALDGVFDMARFHRLGIGVYWQSEYGDINNCLEFEALYSYSPYHAALRHEACHWPAMYIRALATSSRIHPSHSYKLAAAMQTTQVGAAPILLRVHGLGPQLVDDATSSAQMSAEWISFLVSRVGTDSMRVHYTSP